MDKSTTFEITGNLTELCEPKTNGQYTNVEFCISVPGDYPQELRFDAGKKLIDNLNGFRIGDQVNVKFNIAGRRAKSGVVWNTLRAWAMDLVSEAPQQRRNAPRKPLHEQRSQPQRTPVPGGYMPQSNNNDEDDINF